MMKLKLDRIISIATLVASVVAIVLVLKKPSPVAPSQAPAAIAEHAQSFDQKMARFDEATRQTAPVTQAQPAQSAASSQASPVTTAASPATPASKAEVRINSEEISAVLAQALGNAGTAGLTPNSSVGSGAPTIKD